MSYVYIQSERPSADSDGLWSVGFYRPDGTWDPESDHQTQEAAAHRVHWLNGGQPQVFHRVTLNAGSAA